jgi:hypothetical protein
VIIADEIIDRNEGGSSAVGQFESASLFFERQMIFARGLILRISSGVVVFPSFLRSLMLFLATMRAATASIARIQIGQGILARIVSISSDALMPPASLQAPQRKSPKAA